MLPENRDFWIRGDDGLEYGPVELEELREWVRENRAGLGTEVRGDAPGATWQPWQNYPELVALLAEVQVSGADQDVLAGASLVPFWRRILACVLDLILSSILASPIIYVIMWTYSPQWEDQLIGVLLHPDNPISSDFRTYLTIGDSISYLILTLYMFGFYAAHGKTPGKSMLRLRVVNQQGQKPSLFQSLARGVAFTISFYLMGIPFAYAFFNPQRRAFHDFVAGTCVVKA